MVALIQDTIRRALRDELSSASSPTAGKVTVDVDRERQDHVKFPKKGVRKPTPET